MGDRLRTGHGLATNRGAPSVRESLEPAHTRGRLLTIRWSEAQVSPFQAVGTRRAEPVFGHQGH